MTRPVPWTLTLTLLFGDPLAQIGWAFWTLGMVLSWIFVPFVDYDALRAMAFDSSASSRFPPVVLFVLIFPILGGTFATAQIIDGLRRRHLLAHGHAADGLITAVAPTGVTVRYNNRVSVPERRVTAEFIDAFGDRRDATIKVLGGDHQPGEPVTVLFHRLTPTEAVPILPQIAQLDERGHLLPVPVLRALGVTLLPVLGLLHLPILVGALLITLRRLI